MLYREKKERLLPMGVYMGARNMGGWVVVSTGGRWSNSPATAVGASPSRSRLTTIGKVVKKRARRFAFERTGAKAVPAVRERAQARARA